MAQTQWMEIADWLARAGLNAVYEEPVVDGFCDRVLAAGVPISRVNVIVDTLHPTLEGRIFPWRREVGERRRPSEYGRAEPDSDQDLFWRRSPFFHLEQTGQRALRRRLTPEATLEFPVCADHRAEGQTDYLAMIERFASEASFGELNCIYSSWVTDAPEGFTDEHLKLLKALGPALSLALKAIGVGRVARTIAETYLGRDAGGRVLEGRIERGVAETIPAVIWISDLHDFTSIAETAPPGEIIPFLNAYAEAAIDSVREAGGEVLKLIGDGVLAIFRAEPAAEACAAALAAEAALRERSSALGARRAQDGLPVSAPYVGLHLGEVFYGNIGSDERLDFTVVGPAVNQASRICAACREADRDLLVSGAFHAAMTDQDRVRLVSAGVFALRGLGGAQELFGLGEIA